MNRSIWLAALLIGPVLTGPAAAAEPDLAARIAEEMKSVMEPRWYGVYFQGQQKCGFARMAGAKTKVGDQDMYSFEMRLDVRVDMGGVTQKIITKQTRYYKLTGELQRFSYLTDTALGKADISGEVKGDKLELKHTTAGHTAARILPRPTESLAAVVGTRRLIREAKIGGTAAFEVFEPSMSRAFKVTCKLLRFEERLISGVKTRIGVVEVAYDVLPIKTTEYVTTDGEMLETVVGGFFTLRLEPEKVAKDVKTAFDALRAGVIPVKQKLGKPHDVVVLKMRVAGVTDVARLIDDDRQTYVHVGQGAAAVHTVTITPARAPAEPPARPVALGPEQDDIAKWLRPTTLAQSGSPEIIAAAKRIVGDTTDSWQAAKKIQAWVYRTVKKRYLAALSNALGVLKKKAGDCSEHAVLFVALCRAAGIPARQVFGLGYWPRMNGFGSHAWAEVYVGRWVAVDPTWGQDLVDATHLKFGEGESDAFGSAASLLGGLKIEVIEFKRR